MDTSKLPAKDFYDRFDLEAEFMLRFRGIKAAVLHKALDALTPGVNWRGTPKYYIAQCWASARTSHDYDVFRLSGVSLEDIEKNIQK
jgi:hypothetical protein